MPAFQGVKTMNTKKFSFPGTSPVKLNLFEIVERYLILYRAFGTELLTAKAAVVIITRGLVSAAINPSSQPVFNDHIVGASRLLIVKH